MTCPALPDAAGTPGVTGVIDAKIRKQRRRRILLTTIITTALTIVCAFLIRTFLFEIAFVKGRSMMPTLQNGEALFVSPLAYRTGDPERFDVVICHYPGRMMRPFKHIPQNFVKRVIGLPGETVEIIDGVVHINGEPLEEPHLHPRYTKFRTNRPPVTLGEDEYYVMGDNRDNSNDSRRIGPLPRKMIIGKVLRVILPRWKAL